MIFGIKKRLELIEGVSKELQQAISRIEDEVSVLRNESSNAMKNLKKVGLLLDANSGRISSLEVRLTKLETQVYGLSLDIQSLQEKIESMRSAKSSKPSKPSSQTRRARKKRTKKEGKKK